MYKGKTTVTVEFLCVRTFYILNKIHAPHHAYTDDDSTLNGQICIRYS
jgi:hypothetical protein